MIMLSKLTLSKKRSKLFSSKKLNTKKTTFKHTFRAIPTEEIHSERSKAYTYLV